jgi:hypothetical protein
MAEAAKVDPDVVQNIINKTIDDLDPELRKINRIVNILPTSMDNHAPILTHLQDP